MKNKFVAFALLTNEPIDEKWFVPISDASGDLRRRVMDAMPPRRDHHPIMWLSISEIDLIEIDLVTS